MLWDTNIISELAKPQPHPDVLCFAEQHHNITISVITLDELYFGLTWKPRPRIRLWLDNFVNNYCDVLPINQEIARFAGELRGDFQSQGITRTQADMLIAATAVIHRLPLATRNVADFSGCGVTICNPFDPVSTSA